MLETAQGIENCEAIAAVDGIDVLLIGSGDLTTDLGIPDGSMIRGYAPPMNGSPPPARNTKGCSELAEFVTAPSCKVS